VLLRAPNLQSFENINRPIQENFRTTTFREISKLRIKNDFAPGYAVHRTLDQSVVYPKQITRWFP
jgi:hypothetical protein